MTKTRHWGIRDMQSYGDYVKRVTAIHHETVRRLVDHDGTNPRDIAAFFEDVANIYLDISEEIHAKFISEEVERLFPVLQSIAKSSPTGNLEAKTEG